LPPVRPSRARWSREVTYASLLQDRRQNLHARIAEAIETAWAERLTDQVERLAHHAWRGQLWDKAVTYLEQAGAKSFGRSAHREAAAYYEQALDALRHLPESAAAQRKAIDTRMAIRNSLFPLGGLGDDVHRWNAFLPLNACALAHVYLNGGRLPEAGQMAMRALELARRQEQRGEEARAMWVLGEIAARSAPAEAEGRYLSAEALAGALGMRPLVALCRLGLGRLGRHSGDHQRAHHQLADAARMFHEMDMRFWLEQAEADLKSPSR
jgi:tetratricopeptide (TPR) repeat protein